MFLADRSVEHEGATSTGESIRVEFRLAEWAVLVLQQPRSDTASVEQVVHMAWQRTYKVMLSEALHADGTFRSSHLCQRLSNLITLLWAGMFSPEIWISLLEAIHHCRSHFPSIFIIIELLQLLQDLLVLVRHDVLRVSVEELLLLSPQCCWREPTRPSEYPGDEPRSKSN